MLHWESKCHMYHILEARQTLLTARESDEVFRDSFTLYRVMHRT